MRKIVNAGLLVALVLSLPEQRLSADTLYKKKAPVAIGFATTAKSTIDWTDCSRKRKETYVKPPYWVDKGDDCQLRASQFGLGASGKGYVACRIHYGHIRYSISD